VGDGLRFRKQTTILLVDVAGHFKVHHLGSLIFGSKCTTSDVDFLGHFLARCKLAFLRCFRRVFLAAEPRFSAAG
jgi:hypothetical protein